MIYILFALSRLRAERGAAVGSASPARAPCVFNARPAPPTRLFPRGTRRIVSCEGCRKAAFVLVLARKWLGSVRDDIICIGIIGWVFRIAAEELEMSSEIWLD